MSYPYYEAMRRPELRVRQYVPAPYFILKAELGYGEAKRIIMKKILYLLGAAFFAVSCTTTTKTAKTVNSPASLLSATVADLEVSPERITYTMTPGISVRRGGKENVRQAAEQEALLKNGNADVLVDANYTIEQTSFLVFKWVSSITVTGRPAKYTNFHSLNDSVWCNPAFRDSYRNTAKQGGGALGGLFK